MQGLGLLGAHRLLQVRNGPPLDVCFLTDRGDVSRQRTGRPAMEGDHRPCRHPPTWEGAPRACWQLV